MFNNEYTDDIPDLDDLIKRIEESDFNVEEEINKLGGSLEYYLNEEGKLATILKDPKGKVVVTYVDNQTGQEDYEEDLGKDVMAKLRILGESITKRFILSSVQMRINDGTWLVE